MYYRQHNFDRPVPTVMVNVAQLGPSFIFPDDNRSAVGAEGVSNTPEPSQP